MFVSWKCGWAARGGEDLSASKAFLLYFVCSNGRKRRGHCSVLIINTAVVLLLYCQLYSRPYMLSVRTKAFSPAACLQCGEGREYIYLQFWRTWCVFFFFSPLLGPHLFWTNNRHLVLLLLDSEGEQMLGRDALLPTSFLLQHMAALCPSSGCKATSLCCTEQSYLSRRSAHYKPKYTKPKSIKDFDQQCQKRKIRCIV